MQEYSLDAVYVRASLWFCITLTTIIMLACFAIPVQVYELLDWFTRLAHAAVATPMHSAYLTA